MSKFIATFCALALFAFDAVEARTYSSFNYERPASQSTMVFKDREYKFQIEIPESWEMQQGYSQHDLDFVLIAMSAQEGGADRFIENMNILVDRIGQQVSDEVYFTQNLRGVMRDLPNVQLIERKRISVNGETMYKAAYSWDGEFQRITTYQFIFTRGDKGYVVTFTTEPEAYSRYRHVFDQIIGSLAFTEAL